MTSGIKWLASYPKSRNTWARLFLLNWYADANEPLDPNELGKTRFCPACDTPWLWEEATGMSTADFAGLGEKRQMVQFKMRPHVQWFYQHKEERLSAIPPYLKTHSSNANFGGLFPFINWGVTDSAVYLIRDPRRVAPSLADHMGMGMDEAVNSMADDDYSTERDDAFLLLLESWSSHVNGWKNHATVIRAEDLPDAFEDLLKAFGLPTDERLEKAKAFTRLEVLKQFEEENGFNEAVGGQKFFGGKRRTLTKSQTERIEETHEKVMREFGYL